MKKMIMFLMCLIVCSVMVFAQGGGGFTVGTDAGFSNSSTYTTPHAITFSTATVTCMGSTIPIWYLQNAELTITPVPPSNCAPGPNSGDNDDFDSDGCTNKQEYINFLCVNQIKSCSSANLKCACEAPDGICYTNPFLSWCPAYCSHAGELNVDSIPEFSGTALILIFTLAVVAYAFVIHFHKK